VSTADKFRALTKRLQGEVVEAAQDALEAQGDRLVGVIRAAISPHSKTGHLADSVRKLPAKRPLQVRVGAGGPLTTREVRHGSGVSYDYANAEEFGTQDEPAKPFFFPSYRLMKKDMRSAVRKAIAQAVKARSSS